MSNILHNAVIQALKAAHAAYFAGCLSEYHEQLEAAEAGIAAICSLGEPMDGSTGRPIELLCLRGELALQSALPDLNRPERLAQKYELADMMLVSIFKSQVTGADEPWLPNPTSLCDFYGAKPSLVPALEKAAALYGKLTDGGGGGVPELYRAELAMLDHDWHTAAMLAQKSLERMTGDQWIEPIARQILTQKEKENKYETNR